MYIVVHNSLFCLVTQLLKKEQSIQCLHHLERIKIKKWTKDSEVLEL